MLGAAGCKWTTEDRLCGLCIKDADGNFYCKKYHIILLKHHKFNEPWRAKECAEEASKDAWSTIAKGRATATLMVISQLKEKGDY